jgi:hypothetical protein
LPISHAWNSSFVGFSTPQPSTESENLRLGGDDVTSVNKLTHFTFNTVYNYVLHVLYCFNCEIRLLNKIFENSFHFDTIDSSMLHLFQTVTQKRRNNCNVFNENSHVVWQTSCESSQFVSWGSPLFSLGRALAKVGNAAIVRVQPRNVTVRYENVVSSDVTVNIPHKSNSYCISCEPINPNLCVRAQNFMLTALTSKCPTRSNSTWGES